MAAAATVTAKSKLASLIATSTNDYNVKIRPLGDPILQRPAQLFPAKPTHNQLEQLKFQVKTLMANIIETGGAGIAANQCADIDAPFQLTIIGLFKNCEEHMKKIAARYPEAEKVFPEAMIMVNPSIDETATVEGKDELITFTHGCLSVKGGIRAEISTPKNITVSYREVIIEHNAEADSFKFSLSDQKVQTFTGTHAVALKHEIDHIVEGKTYIDRCFEQYSPETLEDVKTLIQNELTFRESSAAAADSSRSNETKSATDKKITISFVDKATGEYIFNPEQFTQALKNLETDILLGLNIQAKK